MNTDSARALAVRGARAHTHGERAVLATLTVAALWRHVLALGAGALLSCAFAPFSWWPLAIAAPAALIALWDGATARTAAWLGFWYGFGMFAAGTYWLYVSVHDFGLAPLWLTALIMLALIGIMAAYHALTGYLVVRIFPAGAIRWLLGAPTIWLLIEWIRGWFLTGFPWLSLGYSQTGTTLAHLAPVVGVYGISLVVLSSAGAVVALLRGSTRVRLVAAAVLIAPWLVSASLGGITWTHAAGAPVSVAVVQGDIPQQDKWLGSHFDQILARYQRLTESAFGAKLIVWPESALPDLINDLVPYVAHLDQAARARGSSLVLGVDRASDDGAHYYNAVLALGRKASWYAKDHLVPFAEFFPVPHFVRRWLRLMSLPYEDFTRGGTHQQPLPVAGLELGPTVCYEVAYGGYMLHMLPKANALVNLTNDAWFGHTTARYQQFQMARMRTQEEGRYMIVATNDGVSAVIGPRGQLIARAPIMRPYVLKATVIPMSGLTPFARLGNALAVSLAVAGLAVAFAMRLLGRRRRRMPAP